MPTIFTTTAPNEQAFRETIFTHHLNANKDLIHTDLTPDDFDYVTHIGQDMYQRDIFLCQNTEEKTVTLTIGIKGDEDYIVSKN